MEKELLISAPNFSTGYFAQLEGREPTDMSQPSANTRLTRLGEAYTRPGYMDTSVDLGLTTPNNLIGYRMLRHTLTFFSGGGTVKYCGDSGNPASPFSTVYTTGLTLTSGTQTTFSEYASDVFVTNATDGMFRIAVMQVGKAAANGDGFLNLSLGDGFRIPAGGGTLRVNGTDYAYTVKPANAAIAGSLTAAGTTATVDKGSAHDLLTGMQVTISGAADNKYNGTYTVTVTGANTFTYTIAAGATSPDTGTSIINVDAVDLTGTVSGTLAVGTYVIYVDTTLQATAPRGSKNEFWIESANVVGVQTHYSTNYVAPRYTHFYADSADGHASGGLAKAYTFSGGKSGNNLVGRKGVLTNILATNDYLFLFTDEETYKIANADVNITSGARIPRLFSPRFGCVNQFCAVTMEQGMIVYLTKNKRVIKSSIAGQTDQLGMAVLFPDEQFDRPVFELLQNMDADQSASRMHYWTKGRLLFITCKIGGQKITLVYDNNVGVWLPPDTNKPFNSYFEIDGELYATQDTDDGVYHVEYGSSDNLSPIDWVVATGVLRAEQGEGDKGLASCDFQETEFVGSIAQGTNLKYHPVIDTTKVGNDKTVPQSAASFPGGENIGNIQIGNITIGGVQLNPDRAPIAYRFANTPGLGFGIQLYWSAFQDGGAASVKAYKVLGRRFTDSFLTTH